MTTEEKINLAFREWVDMMKDADRVVEGTSLAEDGVMPHLMISVPELMELERMTVKAIGEGGE